MRRQYFKLKANISVLLLCMYRWESMHCIQKVKMKGCNSHLKSKKCKADVARDWIHSWPPPCILTWARNKTFWAWPICWALSETGWVSVAIQYVWLPRDSENWRELFHCCIVVSFLCGIALHHWLCSSSVWPVGNLVWVAAQIQTAFRILHCNPDDFHLLQLVEVLVILLYMLCTQHLANYFAMLFFFVVFFYSIAVFSW